LKFYLPIHTYEQLVTCCVCKKSFRPLRNLKLHLYTHNWECLITGYLCKTSVKQSGTLKLHLSAHNGDCPFMCAVCKKSFKQLDALKMYLHIHPGRWPFTVVFLENLSSSLVPRRCTYTLNTLYWQFICDICKNTLMMSSALKVWIIKIMSWYVQIFLLHVKYASLYGNSKIYILNPYSFRQCAKIIMLPGCVNSVWTRIGSCPFLVALGYCHYPVWLKILAADT